MASFKYYLKDAQSKGETAIYLSIYSKGKRAKYYTGKSVLPRYWNEKQQKVVTIAQAPEFNGILVGIKSDASDIALNLRRENETEPSAEMIREGLVKLYNSETELGEQPRDFLSFFKWVTDNIPSRVNEKTQKPLSKKTQEVFRRCYELLLAYQKTTSRKIDFDTIDLDFYYGFKSYLEQKHSFAANTVGKQIRRIKTVMNEATERGINTNLQYKSKRFRVAEETGQNIYLTESELQYMEQLDLTGNKRLNNVRDLFLLACWTGLRFSDFSRLNKSHLVNGCIVIRTKKTGEQVKVPILPMAARILNKHTDNAGLQLPTAISNQKMNEYLKELGQLIPALHESFDKERTQAGMQVSIQKKKWEFLTTHTARRSFATNLFLNQQGRIPVSLIMEMTGHKTEKQFYKYIQMKPSEKATMLKDLFVEFSAMKVSR